MSLRKTRGDLAPAKIKNLLSDEEVLFMFNPFEFTITKNNQWTDKPNSGRNIPEVEFKGGGPVTLKLTLHFDTQRDGVDVRSHTDPLWQMMMISDDTRNQNTNKSEPPPVAFEWGRVYFKAIITDMAQKFTLFSETGVPLRCQVDVSLKQFADENDPAAQIPGQPPGQGTTPSTTMVEGDRLDNVAAATGGNHRDIAEKNNINNPLKVSAGVNLRT